MAGQGGTRQDAENGAILIGRRHLVKPELQRIGYAGLFACAVEHAAGSVETNSRRTPDRAAAPLVAIRTRRHAPPPAALNQFVNAYNTALLMPVAHGAGRGDYWVICDAPPGPCLLERPPGAPLSEAELTALYLRPLTQALSRIHAGGLAHRGVRPGNLYRSETGRILLGPGCLAPPAYDQPVLYEPPGSGLCAPWCRDAAQQADDVYALGVVLLELLLGRPLLPGMPDPQIVQRKLEHGSYALLAGSERLPPSLVSLLRSMLSDDPRARPSLSALAEHGIGAERPKAPRPDARAPRPLMIGRTPVFTARMLAQAFARQPAEALAFLRAGSVDQWLRRALEQSLLAGKIDEALRTGRDRAIEGTDAMILMQIIALLDPLAPLFWGGIWFWPDAMPAMLAHLMVNGEDAGFLAELLQLRAIRRWAGLSGRMVSAISEDVERRNVKASRLPVAELRLPTLCYSVNPYLACLSPELGASCVLGADQLLDALERQVANQSQTHRLLDQHMLSLLAARSDQATDPVGSPGASAATDLRLLDLHMLASAQSLTRSKAGEDSGPEAAGRSHPRLAARLQPAAWERLKTWPGKGRRTRRLELFERAVADGDLVSMLAVIDEGEARSADERALREARGQVEALRVAHRASAEASSERVRTAREGGREIAVAAGVLGLLGAVLASVLL